MKHRHIAFSTSRLPRNSAEVDCVAFATLNHRFPEVSRIFHLCFRIWLWKDLAEIWELNWLIGLKLAALVFRMLSPSQSIRYFTRLT